MSRVGLNRMAKSCLRFAFVLLAMLVSWGGLAQANALIHSSTSTGSTKWPTAQSGKAVDGWGIAGGQYGEFTCGTCHIRNSTNIKRVRSSIATPDGSNWVGSGTPSVAVNFQSTTGPNSFGDDGRTPKTSSNLICEVCHSQTTVHRYDSSTGVTDFNHKNANQTDCIICHQHNVGFKPQACDACHGNPPTADTARAGDGLAFTPQTTGSATAGAHAKHAGSGAGQLGLTCANCHNNYVMPQVSSVKPGFSDISISFSNFGSATGTYTGQAGLSYNNTLGTGGLTCNTVYCHGSTLDGTDSTPAWNEAAGSVACGECHKATSAAMTAAALGSHAKHAGNGVGQLNLACSKCHGTGYTGGSAAPANHVGGTVAWDLDQADALFGATSAYRGANNGATAALAPSATYGQCSSIYCHGSGTPTWGGTVNCGDCHAVNNGLTASHATHYGTATAGVRTDAISSTSGAYVFQCDSCHTGVAHVDGNKQVAISATYGGSMDGSKVCSNVYCHGNGNGAAGAVNPTWAVTSMTCGSCHAAEPTTARHTKHIDNSTYNINCSQCHVATTTNGTTINDKSAHVNKVKNVDWGTLSSGGTAYVNPATNCSNIYCHSDGKSTTAPFGAPKVNVAWGTATAMTCTSCHDNANATTTLSAAHQAHTFGATATVGRDLGCEQCHADTVSSSTTLNATTGYAVHVDGGKTIKVAIDNSTCNNIQCHSNGNFDGTVTYNNPAWNTTLGCASCHGNGTVSYPAYADGGAGTGASNSHNKHVGSSGLTCEECHATTSKTGTSLDGSTPANHVNQAVEVSFKQGGSINASETCSTTYCHGSGTPQWGGAALACDACHSASSALANNHGAHFQSATAVTVNNTTNAHTAGAYVFACGNCHVAASTNHAAGKVSANQAAQVAFSGGGTYTAGGTSAGTDRGFSYTAGTCASTACHQDGRGGAPNVVATWAGSLGTDCTGCHNNNKAAGAGKIMASNAHGAHVNDGTIMTDKSCEACHTVTVDSTDRAIADKTVHVNGTRNVDIDAAWDSNAAPADNWTAGTSTCNNVYCHSNGQATPTYQPVVWTATIGTCTACHGGAGTTTTLTASHLYHIGTDATDTNKQFGYTCDVCHVQTASSNSVIGTPANHVNKSRDVAVAAAKGGTGVIGGDFAGGKCATTLCHGTSTPDWTAGATTGNCSTCHGMAASTTDGRDTNGETLTTDPQVGAHVAHLSSAKNWSADIACAQCHKTTVTNINAAGTYVAKVNATGHLDAVTADAAELTFDTLASTNGATPAYNGATCATTYCHDGSKIGNGWSGTLNVPDWNTPFFNSTTSHDCAFCHGYPPNPANGHPNSTDCSACHPNTVAADNGFVDVTKHVNGIVETQVDSCNACHGTGAYKDPEVADPDHKSHVNTNTYLTGKTISGGALGGAGWYDVGYDASSKPQMGCGQCHPANLHRDGFVQTDLDPAGETITAPNAKLNSPAGAMFNGTKCSNVYCHSDGNGTFADSPNWDATAFNANLTCASCHGNSPTTGTHNWHEVGIHYKTLYDDDGDGLMPAGAAPGTDPGAAHGNTATSSTIGCQTCHNNTVTVTYNAGNSVCGTCHSDTNAPATGNELAMIKASSTSHLDGAKSVVFASLSGFKAKSQLRNDITTVTALNNSWTRTNGYKGAAGTSYDAGKNATPTWNSGAKTCSTVDCHNGITTPNWSAGSSANCLACHTTLPQ